MAQAIIWGYIINIKPTIVQQNRVKKILANFCVFFPLDGEVTEYFFDYPTKKIQRFVQFIPDYKH